MENYLFEVLDQCSVDDLKRGYVHDIKNDRFICLCCGQEFENGIIFPVEDQLCSAEKAIRIHIDYEHGGQYYFLLNLDRKYTGISERQKEIFEILYEKKDNHEIAEILNTSPSTVRSYKFKNQAKLRQAKIFLAIGDLLEEQNSRMVNENESKKKYSSPSKEDHKEPETNKARSFDLNFMNPFIRDGRPRIK